MTAPASLSSTASNPLAVLGSNVSTGSLDDRQVRHFSDRGSRKQSGATLCVCPPTLLAQKMSGVVAAMQRQRPSVRTCALNVATMSNTILSYTGSPSWLAPASSPTTHVRPPRRTTSHVAAAPRPRLRTDERTATLKTAAMSSFITSIDVATGRPPIERRNSARHRTRPRQGWDLIVEKHHDW